MKYPKQLPAALLLLTLLLCAVSFTAFAGDEPAPACTHNLVFCQKVEPECEQTGCLAHYCCTNCSALFAADDKQKQVSEADLVLPALGHLYSDWMQKKAATCTEPGLRIRSCQRDLAHVDKQEIPPRGHSYGAWQYEVVPTCTEGGQRMHACIRDASHIEREAVPPLGHAYGDWITKKASTCTAHGLRVRICQNNTSHTIEQELPLSEHSYVKTTAQQPTAVKAGYAEYPCRACGALKLAADGKPERTALAPTGTVAAVKCNARTAAAESITWSALKGAQGYQIKISTPDGKSWAKTYNAKTATGLVFKNLKAGGTYKFSVRIYSKDVNGQWAFGPWTKATTSPTLPAGTAVTKLVGGKKCFAAQWKRTNVTGYQLQYATNGSFRGAKTITIRNALTYKALAKNLLANRAYCVRIRTYKTIAGANYFSTWSKAVTVKTK
ncbi:MAG: fibronectin type III domain-containing protein [Clostridia bacterium]|nr:fibronectin type III domain-containing protein [Clostridia bacterium]